MTMRTVRNIAFVVMVGIYALAPSPAVGSVMECDPDDMTNSDCGPFEVCDPGTLTCSEDCNDNPTQCAGTIGWWCPAATSYCAPIGK